MLTRKLFTAALCALGTALYAASANAQVIVAGGGPAQDCFHSAEGSGEAREGIVYCNAALDGGLQVRDRAATLVNRGILYLAVHDDEKALLDISEGIRLAPDLGDAYVDRGAVLFALGRDSDALADINKGIAIGLHRPQIAYYNRAIINEKNGDVRAAYYDYKKALDLAPDFAPAAVELKRFRVVHNSDGA